MFILPRLVDPLTRHMDDHMWKLIVGVLAFSSFDITLSFFH